MLLRRIQLLQELGVFSIVSSVSLSLNRCTYGVKKIPEPMVLFRMRSITVTLPILLS